MNVLAGWTSKEKIKKLTMMTAGYTCNVITVNLGLATVRKLGNDFY